MASLQFLNKKYDAIPIFETRWVGIITWPMSISAIKVGGHHEVEHLTFCFTLGKTANHIY